MQPPDPRLILFNHCRCRLRAHSVIEHPQGCISALDKQDKILLERWAEFQGTEFGSSHPFVLLVTTCDSGASGSCALFGPSVHAHMCITHKIINENRMIHARHVSWLQDWRDPNSTVLVSNVKWANSWILWPMTNENLLSTLNHFQILFIKLNIPYAIYTVSADKMSYLMARKKSVWI